MRSLLPAGGQAMRMRYRWNSPQTFRPYTLNFPDSQTGQSLLAFHTGNHTGWLSLAKIGIFFETRSIVSRYFCNHGWKTDDSRHGWSRFFRAITFCDAKISKKEERGCCPFCPFPCPFCPFWMDGRIVPMKSAIFVTTNGTDKTVGHGFFCPQITLILQPRMTRIL